MKQVILLTAALEFIEQNLDSNIKTSDIANACYCSKSTIEKMFRCINNISVHDYILRRKMTSAARLILSDTDMNLLDVALHFGYSSNESFTRAFEHIWHCKPSEYRKKQRYYELYPRLLCPLKIGDEYMDTRKHVDISELYDLFQERSNCYFVCCDIKGLIPINNISHAAGDKAIIESLNRILAAAGDEDIVFRIGGDEFALLTDCPDCSYAEQLAKNISEHNGETFDFEGQKISLSLYTSITRLENTKKYSDLFTNLHNVIRNNKPIGD